MTKTPINMEKVKRPDFVDRHEAVRRFFKDLEDMGTTGALKQWFPTHANADRAYHSIWYRLNAAGRGKEFFSHITPESDGYALYIMRK